MATSPTGPGRAGALNSDEPGSGRVLAFPDRRPPMPAAGRAPGFPEGGTGAILQFGRHFTAADHAALAAWACDNSHGYDRLHLDQGMLENGNWASYALIYVPGQAWSTWGMTRRDDHVEVWRCANGQTKGHHARMEDALDSLPHAATHRRTSSTEVGRAGMRLSPSRTVRRDGRPGNVR